MAARALPPLAGEVEGGKRNAERSRPPELEGPALGGVTASAGRAIGDPESVDAAGVDPSGAWIRHTTVEVAGRFYGSAAISGDEGGQKHTSAFPQGAGREKGRRPGRSCGVQRGCRWHFAVGVRKP